MVVLKNIIAYIKNNNNANNKIIFDRFLCGDHLSIKHYPNISPYLNRLKISTTSVAWAHLSKIAKREVFLV